MCLSPLTPSHPPSTLKQANAEITIQDDFVDESGLTQLLDKFPAKVGKHFRQMVDVPLSLYERMVDLVVLSHHERKALAAAAATTAVQLPARREYTSFLEHKDVYADMSAVDQNIGLLYLKGDGVMRFTHDETGEETHVDVKPGRFLTWDNSAYTHFVIPGQQIREMVGPVAFKDASPHMVSVDTFGMKTFQAYADRLVVTPGSLLRIRADLILQEWPGDFTKGPTSNEINIFCTTLTPNARALKTQGSNAETKFRKASIFPNTYKVSPSYTVHDIFNTNDRAHPLFSFPAYPHPTSAQAQGRGGERR
jgi:hypothetical protein